MQFGFGHELSPVVFLEKFTMRREDTKTVHSRVPSLAPGI